MIQLFGIVCKSERQSYDSISAYVCQGTTQSYDSIYLEQFFKGDTWCYISNSLKQFVKEVVAKNTKINKYKTKKRCCAVQKNKNARCNLLDTVYVVAS